MKSVILIGDLFIFRCNSLKGRKDTACRVLRRGRMNSCRIEFVRDGYRAIVSRSALRRMTICDLHR